MKILPTVLAVCALGAFSPVMARDSGHHGGGSFSGHGHSHSFSGHSHGFSSHGSSHGFAHHRGFDRSSFDFGIALGTPYYYGYDGPSYYTDAVPYDDYSAPVYSDDGSSVAAEVQMALARRGYYHGDVDGVMGPMSQDAIARYQANHGLAVTGVIDAGLLRSLGIR